jgi:hypothetical protein
VKDEVLEYQGHRIRIQVGEVDAESATGVFLTSVTVWRIARDGSLANETILARRSQGIYLDGDAAYAAAQQKAMRYLDGLAGV